MNRIMDDLNERLKKIENRLIAVEEKLSIRSPSSLSNLSQHPSLYQSKPNPQEYNPFPFSSWLKENWLVSIGIFLITLAIGWFISYAFANDWIKETARVFLGLITGVITYSAGLWILKKQTKGGQALIILGEVIMISTLFASHQIYSLLPSFSTFLWMLVVISITAIIAIKNNLESLSLSSIIFAAIIPLLIHVNFPNSTFLMLYVLIINLAALWMWTMREWGKHFKLHG